MKLASETSRTSGFALALLFVTAVIELFVVAFASAGFDEVADASPFGHPGTAIVAVVVAAVALIGTVVAWRVAAPAIRTVTAILVSVGVGIIALMAFFFVAAGGTPIIFAILLALAAVSMGMIGRALMTAAPSGTGG